MIDKLGNQFLEDDNELLVLDTSDIAPAAFIIADTIRPLSYRQNVYKTFIDRSVSVFGPVKKLRTAIILNPSRKDSINHERDKCCFKKLSFFSRLYILSNKRRKLRIVL